MRKFRNTFYNISDIVAAVLIVLFAALLILWRTHIILDYPQKLVAEAFAQNEAANAPITLPYERTDSQTSEGAVASDTSGAAVTEGPAGAGTAEIFSLYINMGDSVATIGSNLVTLGCFESSAEFVNMVTAMGVDTKLQIGMHYFPASATKEEVITALTQPGM